MKKFNKILIKRYAELHGKLIANKAGLYPKLSALIEEMDRAGIMDRYERELRKIELFEKEACRCAELREFKSLASSLFR